jgi:hypothetical protein
VRSLDTADSGLKDPYLRIFRDRETRAPELGPLNLADKHTLTKNRGYFTLVIGEKKSGRKNDRQPAALERWKDTDIFGGGERIRTAASRFCRPLP